MKAFYNEIDPYAAEWLGNLSSQNLIVPGRVETRSIVDLKPKDLEGYQQAHFFAGIGGWSRALRLAGWPDDEEVWSGSCPCQPWSQAGKGKGEEDERHLWPAWFELIQECTPRVIFGEQVASDDGLRWLDLVYSDLELSGYAVWAADTCAAGVGTAHIRQRLYFVAYAEHSGVRERVHVRSRQPQSEKSHTDRGGKARELADTKSRRAISTQQQRRVRSVKFESAIGAARELGNPSSPRSRGNPGAVPRAKTKIEREGIESRSLAHEPELAGAARLMGDSGGARSPLGPGPEERFGAIRLEGSAAPAPGATSGFWSDAEWWLCRDGKARPAKPGAYPLVDGLPRGMARLRPSRVGVLRGLGNAIVPQQAAVFIRAVAPLIGVRLKE